MNTNFKTILLGFSGILSIYFYYVFYPFHGESKQGLIMYILWLVLAYGLYLLYRYYSVVSSSSSITSKTILWFFSVQLLFLCMYFFALGNQNIFLWTYLFIKIIFILACISFLWWIFWSTWNTFLSFKKFPQIENAILKNVSSLALWCVIFVYGLFIFAALWVLNIYAVVIWTIALGAFSYKIFLYGLLNVWNTKIHSYEVIIDSKNTVLSRLNISRIIDEFHYIIITFLLSINFINVYRPYPIWWDDLGAYMNYPKLLSSSGELLGLSKMYFWELYTSVWFLFGSQTFAFFLNSFSGVIAAIGVVALVRLVVWKKYQNFDIGLLMALILLMMPMTVFQLAKDMKLDYGLIFMSMSAMTVFFSVILKKEKYDCIHKNIYLFILVWIFLWAAFAIKVTTLLLLLWILWTLFYVRWWILSFLWFIFLFIWVFTLGNLWSMMNVVIPAWASVKVSGWILIALWIWSIFLTQFKDTSLLKKVIWESAAVLFGFILILAPWGLKHIGETIVAKESFSVGKIISWTWENFVADYSMIYSREELDNISGPSWRGLTASGTTKNADFWRYFWYEKGINNYLKLPWNLSFQVNQKWEFTDISYVFIALIPILFLFLPYKRKDYTYLIWASYIFILTYFIPFSPLSEILTDLFARLTLPFGYVLIFLFFFLPFVFFHFALDKREKISEKFLIVYSFSVIYVWLWAVSAFGIVWYGISMYVIFFLLIGLCLSYINKSQNNTFSVPLIISLFIIWVYVFQSALPHGISNLRNAWAENYKLGYVNENESIFGSHPDYFTILFHTNIDPRKKEEFFKNYRNATLKIIDTENTQELIPVMQWVKNISDLYGVINQIISANISTDINIKLRALLNNMYNEIVFPSEDNKSNENIYRAGTFLKYYISENHKRLFVDNLLEKFQTYFYDENFSLISERLRKIWIHSLIVDLNAATIDNDPEKLLTQRYENMLSYFTDKSLKLIETDSICLKVWLASYKKDEDMKKYMNIAGVNYGWDRNLKKEACIIEILTFIQNGDVTESRNTFLIPYMNFVTKNLKPELSGEEATKYYVNLLVPYLQNGYKALFEIQE